MARLRTKDLAFLNGGPVSLTVDRAQCVCISGPSGSGKTLMLRALADLDPHEGKVCVDEDVAASVPAPVWRRRVGMLPAESAWWRDDVGGHFPVRDDALLESLGFGSDALGWTVARLSTGERQRLALARLLANKPDVLLLDEPTASLDPDNVARVESVIRTYRDDLGAAVLWVTHDPAQIKRVAHRHLRMNGGALTESKES